MEDLPFEILRKVMEYLPAEDLCRCAMTCKNFNLWADEDSLWKSLCLNELSERCGDSSFAVKRKRLMHMERELEEGMCGKKTSEDEVMDMDDEEQSQASSPAEKSRLFKNSWKHFYSQHLHGPTRRKRIQQLLQRLRSNDNPNGMTIFEYPVLMGEGAPPTFIQLSSLSCASQVSPVFPPMDQALVSNFDALTTFIEIVTDPSLYIPYLLINSVKYERNTYSFCCSLVDLFTAVGDVFSLLFCSIFDEVTQVSINRLDQSRLFRSESLFNRMLGHYFHLIGSPYLHMALKAPLNKLLADLGNLNFSSPKLDALFYYQLFLDSILASSPSFPIEIRKICHYLHQEVGRRFPEKANFYVYLVLFYRFFCPAIMSYHSLQTTIKSHLVQIAVLLRNEAREAVVPCLSTATLAEGPLLSPTVPVSPKAPAGADIGATASTTGAGSTFSTSRGEFYDKSNIENLRKFFTDVVGKPSYYEAALQKLRDGDSPTQDGASLLSNEQLKKAISQIYHSFVAHKNDIFTHLLAIGQTEKIHLIERVLHELKPQFPCPSLNQNNGDIGLLLGGGPPALGPVAAAATAATIAANANNPPPIAPPAVGGGGGLGLGGGGERYQALPPLSQQVQSGCIIS